MKIKYLLTTSALAVGFFLSTQTGQPSHIPHGDPQKNPPSLTAGTSTLPDSLEDKKRPLPEEEGTENAIIPAKRSRLSAEEGQAANRNHCVLVEFYDLLTAGDGFFQNSFFKFLSWKDWTNFALTNKELYKLVRQTQMISDPRRLHEKVWIGGPERSTWANYIFNATMQEVMRGLLLVSLDTGNNSNRRPYLKSVPRTISRLKEKFSDYDIEYILDDLEKSYKFSSMSQWSGNQYELRQENTLAYHPSRQLRKNAKDKCNKPERELLTLIHYILFSRERKFSPYPGTLLKNYKKFFDPTKSAYFDPAAAPNQMGVLERLFQVEERLRSLELPHQKTPEEVAGDWDFVLQYSPQIALEFHYSASKPISASTPITLYFYRRACRAYVAAQDYTKATNVIEKMLEINPNSMWDLDLSLDEYRRVAKEALNVKKYSLAAEFYTKIFNSYRYGPHVIIDDYRNAAAASFYAKNYDRVAALYEEVFDKYPQDVAISDYRNAAAASFYARNYDRAAAFREKVLDKYPQNVGVDDYRNAAIAHFRAKNDARAIQLCKMFLERDPRLAVEIYEQAFRTHPQHRTPDNCRYAAKANYHAGFYDKAIMFYEEILKNNPWDMADEDYNFVSMAYVREGDFVRAAEIKRSQDNTLQSLMRFGALT